MKRGFNILGCTHFHKDALGRNIYDNLHVKIVDSGELGIPLVDQLAYVYTYWADENHRDKRPPFEESLEGQQVMEYTDPAIGDTVIIKVTDVLSWKHVAVIAEYEQYEEHVMVMQEIMLANAKKVSSNYNDHIISSKEEAKMFINHWNACGEWDLECVARWHDNYSVIDD